MFDHFQQRVGQKRQSPPGAALGWIRASQSNELYLFLAAQLSSSPGPWLFTEGGLQADFLRPEPRQPSALPPGADALS
jgi:hypothetical protein